MSWRNLTVLGLILCVGASASAASQRRKVHKAKAAPPVATSPAPQPDEPPPTPEQGPSSPPDVSFHGGQLTIIARNSTLGDVLNAVRAKTGASVEMPPASSERVVGQFGPGAPRDVMAQLLNGSHYDYVLVGSPAEPGALKKVVLTVRSSLPPQTQQASNAPPPAYNQGNQAQQVEPDQQDLPNEDATTDAQPEAPPQAEQEEPQGGPPQQNPGGPVVKTPEQLLRELQQQQQQMNQGQPPQ